jgi:NADP-dependent 3-hydroxy acid dehydrogenase YdfG
MYTIYTVGEELCYQLSNAGAKLIMTARNENRLNTIWRSLSVPDNAK